MLQFGKKPRCPLPLCLAGFFLSVSFGNPLSAQDRPGAEAGPIIQDFGSVYRVPEVDFPLDPGMSYRVVFDVSVGADAPDQVNSRIETLARFLNMHAQAGVPAENMDLVLVLHGTAGKDALDDPGYRERYGIDNPNRALLTALDEAGVEIYLCGQTSVHRNLPADELAPTVRMALSAMTVLVTRQAQGYSLIAF
jgi:intracellular sulfur oxidation DsrE/DsrF family protein